MVSALVCLITHDVKPHTALSSRKAEGQQHQQKTPSSNPQPSTSFSHSPYPLSINASMSPCVHPMATSPRDERLERVGVVVCVCARSVGSKQKKRSKGEDRWRVSSGARQEE